MKRARFVGLVAGLVASFVVVGCADPSRQDGTIRSGSGQIVEEGNLGAFRIQTGDCLYEVPRAPTVIGGMSEITDATAVPCTQLHMYEAYATFDLSGTDYPGASAVGLQARAGCLPRFESFVGLDYESSKYGYFSLFPTAESWRLLNDREVVCLISNYDDSRKTRSARNTRE